MIYDNASTSEKHGTYSGQVDGIGALSLAPVARGLEALRQRVSVRQSTNGDLKNLTLAGLRSGNVDSLSYKIGNTGLEPVLSRPKI